MYFPERLPNLSFHFWIYLFLGRRRQNISILQAALLKMSFLFHIMECFLATVGIFGVLFYLSCELLAVWTFFVV